MSRTVSSFYLLFIVFSLVVLGVSFIWLCPHKPLVFAEGSQTKTYPSDYFVTISSHISPRECPQDEDVGCLYITISPETLVGDFYLGNTKLIQQQNSAFLQLEASEWLKTWHKIDVLNIQDPAEDFAGVYGWRNTTINTWVEQGLTRNININPQKEYVPREELNYETNCQQSLLKNLKEKRLAILSFGYEDNMLSGGEMLDPIVAQIITDYHYEGFKVEFSSLFNITDLSTDNSIIKDSDIRVEDKETIRNILQNNGFDGGIIVVNGYGFILSGAPFDNAAGELLGKFFPPFVINILEALLGPSFVQFYYFASNTYIVDNNGDIVWNFYGKVPAPGKLLSGSLSRDLEAMGRAAISLNPSEQEQIASITQITGHYTKFLKWLIEEDIEGAENKNYFTDFQKTTDDMVPNISCFRRIT